jgi:hypothetical protein
MHDPSHVPEFANDVNVAPLNVFSFFLSFPCRIRESLITHSDSGRHTHLTLPNKTIASFAQLPNVFLGRVSGVLVPSEKQLKVLRESQRCQEAIWWLRVEAGLLFWSAFVKGGLGVPERWGKRDGESTSSTSHEPVAYESNMLVMYD